MFPDGQLSCNFNKAAAENLENQQTSIQDYRKPERCRNNYKCICERLSLNCICDIVLEFFFAYRQAFSAVV